MLLHEFNQYYMSRASNFTEQFIIASKNGNQDAIHDLRVEIKRLRAFFELMKGIGLNFNLKKIITPIRNLFKSAAVVRDAQVLQTLSREIISKFGLNINVSEYINALKQKEMKGIKKYLKDCKGFNLSVLEKHHKMINTELSKISEPSIETAGKAYLKNLLDTVNQLKIKSDFEKNDFHKIRILCKKTRYTLEILTSLYSKTDFDLLNDSLRGVHQAVGHWHDTDAAIIFLHNILADPNIKPLFSESSYSEFLKLLEDRKQQYYQLFFERFNLLDFTNFEKKEVKLCQTC